MFVIDSKSEGWLTQRGVPFAYQQNVRFDQLVPNWEGINQGRPDGVPRDEALVEKYAFAMNQPGAAFPAVILAQSADGLEVLDGIQRLLAAFLNDHKAFNAYVVKTDNPSVRAGIRICANSVLNGQPPSMDWTVQRVVDVLYDQHRLSPMDCAVWAGIHVNKIHVEINSRDGALWMKNHGIDLTLKPANQKGFQAVFSELFPMTEREKVAKVLPKIVQAIQGVKATNNEAELLLRECTQFAVRKGVPLHDQLQAKFEEVIERPDIKARMMGRRKLHPIEEVKRAVACAVTVMKKAVDGDQHADEGQATEIVELVIQVRDLARKIIPKESWGPIGFGPKH